MALLKLLLKWASSKPVYHAPFPEHVWSRHSALLVAARQISHRR